MKTFLQIIEKVYFSDYPYNFYFTKYYFQKYNIKISTNNNGTITIYHATSKTNAQQILNSGCFKQGNFMPTLTGNLHGDTLQKYVISKGKGEGVIMKFNINPFCLEINSASEIGLIDNKYLFYCNDKKLWSYKKEFEIDLIEDIDFECNNVLSNYFKSNLRYYYYMGNHNFELINNVFQLQLQFFTDTINSLYKDIKAYSKEKISKEEVLKELKAQTKFVLK